MRFFKILVSVALVADAAVASTWFTKAAYNKWHENELERWLSDHDIPYPTPADRRDLEKLVEKNWQANVVHPYHQWQAVDLQAFLKQKGVEAKDASEANRDHLLSKMKAAWYETEDKAQQAYGGAKDWILDSWTESKLKEFCDHHGIPVPQPRTRDTILQKARANYETLAQKAGETAAYPGNWLYETWTESDLKEWLDTHGFPAPQPTTRDKLIAAVRRNSRLAYLKMQDQAASASASAQAAFQTLTDKLIDSWGESDLKEFCDKNGIKVPQGTKVNELRALVRRHRAEIHGDTVSGSAASAFGAATSKAGNEYARASSDASKAGLDAFNEAVDTWSESRLKAYLDARGIPVPQGSKKDHLRALVRKNAHKAASRGHAWTFDDMSADKLKEYLRSQSDATAKRVANRADASRDDLVKAARSAYNSASKAGGSNYASATNYLASATEAVKDRMFDTWSDSEIKSYLDSYGIPVPQGSKLDELRAYARKQATYFKYGTTSPTDTIFAKLGESVRENLQWVMDQLNIGADTAKQQAHEAKDKAAKESQKLKEEL